MSDYHHNSLFSEPWWLDAIAGSGNWGEALVESGGKCHARLPYAVKKRHGLIILCCPPLTQHLGPWFAETNAKYAKALARQKDMVGELLNQLPPHHMFQQCFHHSVTNWLPWYWQGFEQTTRYTYVFDDLSNEQALWDGMQSNIRSDIRKALNRFGLIIRTDLGPQILLETCQKTFQRQDIAGLSEQVVMRLYDACSQHHAGKAFFAVDDQNRVHAAVYIVWDDRAAFYLLGGGDPEFRNSGAHSLLMWEMIKFASTVTRSFDFEGSMIEPVERFFRAFGARQVPYHQISRYKNKWLKAAWHLRESVKTMVAKQ
jgi:lipid II:glycine glycyltransferase (peptidoglycan interpeptide bridge formation enzyme)